MKRLTGTDALFLSMETPSWHQHVGGLTVLEPGDRPITFDGVMQSIEARLDSAPKFRWKLKMMPLGLDRPVWVDDEQFDIRRHVRRIGVPSPGGARETAEIAGGILESQLDRSRPLWELWFLEGLAGGRVALLLKYHHCLLDGVSGASLATVLLDLEPDATGSLVAPPSPEEQTAGHEPSTAAVLGQLVSEAVRRPSRHARYVVRGSRKIAAGLSTGSTSEGPRALLGAPTTPWNAAIGPRRALSFASISLDDVKELKAHHGVKVNDVVLAIAAGALRAYLLEQDLLPDAPLSCAVPVSTRAEGDTTQDNQVSTMFMTLATDVEDPVARLQSIHASAMSAKAMQQAMSVHQIQSLGEVAAPLILSTAMRTMYRTRLISRMPARVNTMLSNVPGPPIQLYCCGGKVTGIFPCSVITEGMGMNTTVMTYKDRVDVGFHVDPDLVPDPWAVATLVPKALAELKAASGLGPVRAVLDPFGDAPERLEDASPPAVPTPPKPTKKATTRKSAPRKTVAPKP